MNGFYADGVAYGRLLAVIEQRLGHALIGRAENAKIAVAELGGSEIDLGLLSPGLKLAASESGSMRALEAELAEVVDAAIETLAQAGLPHDSVDALYFTGGSTGLKPLTDRIEPGFRAPKSSAETVLRVSPKAWASTRDASSGKKRPHGSAAPVDRPEETGATGARVRAQTSGVSFARRFRPARRASWRPR